MSSMKFNYTFNKILSGILPGFDDMFTINFKIAERAA